MDDAMSEDSDEEWEDADHSDGVRMIAAALMASGVIVGSKMG